MIGGRRAQRAEIRAPFSSAARTRRSSRRRCRPSRLSAAIWRSQSATRCGRARRDGRWASPCPATPIPGSRDDASMCRLARIGRRKHLDVEALEERARPELRRCELLDDLVVDALLRSHRSASRERRTRRAARGRATRRSEYRERGSSDRRRAAMSCVDRHPLSASPRPRIPTARAESPTNTASGRCSDRE